MRVGMDFSEHNGPLPWGRLAKAGLSFAILRLGWGREHLDGRFYENVNGAWDHGIPLGVYYYSYALAPEEAAREARFLSLGLSSILCKLFYLLNESSSISCSSTKPGRRRLTSAMIWFHWYTFLFHLSVTSRIAR